ncbi:uncharacterized protein LOC102706529 [Oryza brachyantha]|uniref:Uncharacterized protein n=1 Tax=Oryza brachyantha TaxID=4533 RepID=J3KUD8_ORYBR|nr:uncharacterized protein LOC102706529 [Oryza brachyantha]
MAQESHPLLALLLMIFLMVAKVDGLCMGCMNDHIVVSQLAGGGGVHTVFRVTVTNRCCCAVRHVVVAAPGFRSAIPIDPRLFRRINSVDGEEYLVGDGEAVPANGSVTFSYAWRAMFRISVVGITVSNCL